MAISNWNTFEDIRADLMAWAACIAIGWACGWLNGHYSAASNCERLGAFYVGGKTFECQKVSSAKKDG